MNICIVFGGKSCERDVSIVTACQIYPHLLGQNAIPVYVDENGAWWHYKGDMTIDAIKSGKSRQRVYLRAGEPYLYKRLRRFVKPDVMLCCMHGRNGEDGQFSALCQASNLPYTCCDVAPSALGMDKWLTKLTCKGLKIPVLDGIVVCESDIPTLEKKLADFKLDYPFVVKPVSLGSSIGIKVAKNTVELLEGIDLALHFDTRVLIEPYVPSRVEYNCAIMKSGAELLVGRIEKPIGTDEILSFADKYLREGKLKGMENTLNHEDCDLHINLASKIKAIAKKLYDAMDAKGVVRFDFIQDAVSGKIYLNEINTVPGSLAYYMFDIKTNQFLLELCKSAIAAQQKQQKLQYAFEIEPLYQK